VKPKSALTQAGVGVSAALLAVGSIPASYDQALTANDDSLCVFVGLLFFGLVLPFVLLDWGTLRGAGVALGLFLGAALLQLWSLFWVETAPFHRLVANDGGLILSIWAAFYMLSAVGATALAIALIWKRT
jgi:hypothetical protein